ncbi:Serine/threonine-protein kinase B [Legionella birminghamensis]|uniref:Serine/threonine-protein kinase B n=1 Tax=Legionella birminghamensis TaxID=28083 RepID=A0A378IC11_9GAMM|nr:pentapeptide repeat-containing protein [Legionella birminghamensis]KTC73053.1 Serine/threonine-protein kinase B [Legionella birminghamensis]STX32370.1 Serine/threonine-protein kinase B [Legionella birminghamensis]
MKTYLFIYLISLSTSIYSQQFSNPLDVKQFEKTGVCESCDLSNDYYLYTDKLGAINLNNSNLTRSNLGIWGNHQYSSFSRITAIELSLGTADFAYSDFSFANLKNAKLSLNNFTSSDFTGANLSGASFAGANLYQAKITEKQLKSMSSICNAILPDGKVGSCDFR